MITYSYFVHTTPEKGENNNQTNKQVHTHTKHWDGVNCIINSQNEETNKRTRTTT